jgi:hypothetical protein
VKGEMRMYALHSDPAGARMSSADEEALERWDRAVLKAFFSLTPAFRRSILIITEMMRNGQLWEATPFERKETAVPA